MAGTPGERVEYHLTVAMSDKSSSTAIYSTSINERFSDNKLISENCKPRLSVLPRLPWLQWLKMSGIL